jgi:two-component system, NtrC family, sensor kinase
MDRSVPRTAVPQAPPQRPARILIAEDDGSAASLLEALLSRVGYEVAVATDGAEALRMLEAGPPPDVLLLDWMLPEASGLDICKLVRAKWDPLMLPILMVTAKADADSIAEAFAVGVSDYLAKPFLGAELRARVAAHLRIKQLIEERARIDEHLMEREKLSALGLLVSGVAHDLKNPLGGISGYAQLLLEEEHDPQKVESLRRIMDEVQRCDRIVGELLSFARRHPPERAHIDVGQVLRSTVELRERQLQSWGLRTRVDIAPELPTVFGDPHQLQQVFLNIMINAEQALRDSGETLQISAGRAVPSTRRPDGSGWVALTFYNDGPPIPPDVLPRIFQPFFTTKDEDEGTGLGLSICQRIVREHGGEMDVESGTDGTTFRVFLPANGSSPAARAAATPPTGS